MPTSVDSEKRSVISGLFWKFGERALAQVVSFVVSLVLARLLTPSEYGVVAMVLVFIALADVFAGSGFATGLIQKKDADERDFSTMFYCSLACSVLLYGVIFACAPAIAGFYSEPSLVLILRVFALRIPLSAVNAIQHAYVSRHMLFKRFFYSTLVGAVVSGVVGIVLALLGFGVWALIAQYFVNTMMDAVVLFCTVPWRPRLLFSASSAKGLMRYGWKVLAADLSGTFFGQLRSLVVGKAYTPVDLAFYNRGQQVPNLVMSNVGSALMSVLFPAMSNHADDPAKVKAYCRRSYQALSYLIAPFLMGMAAVAVPLVDVLFSSKWLESVPFLQIMCIDCIIGTLSVVSLQAIKAIGRSDVVLKLEFIKKPVYVVLLFAGMMVNVYAVAITMVVYEVYGAIVNMIQLGKHLNYSVVEQLRDIMPAIALSSLMALVVLVVPVPGSSILALTLKIAIGASMYIGLSALTKNEAFGYTFRMMKAYLNDRANDDVERKPL